MSILPDDGPDERLVLTLVQLGCARSKAEARRLIAQGAVWWERGGLRVAWRFYPLAEAREDTAAE